MARVRLGWLPPNEAEVACVVLVSAGLDAVVVGEARSALVGVLPPTDFQAELWVEEAQLEQARAILESKPIPDERPPPAETTTSPRRWPLLTVLLAISTLVLAVLLIRERQQSQQARNPFTEYRYTQGCVITYVHRAKRYVHCDTNQNGISERTETWDRKGKLALVVVDKNEDGFDDYSDLFDVNGTPVNRSFDKDGDWRDERLDGFDDEGRLFERLLDEDGDGRFDVTLALLEDGGLDPSTVWLDGGYDSTELTDAGSILWSRRASGSWLAVVRDGGVVRRQKWSDDGWTDVSTGPD